jgi:NADH-quinone oxidoreductase subunit K
MSIELALLSVNIMFLVASVFIDDHIAHVLVLFILVVAAAESSIGLAILIPFFRLKGTVSTTFAKSLIG